MNKQAEDRRSFAEEAILNVSDEELEILHLAEKAEFESQIEVVNTVNENYEAKLDRIELAEAAAEEAKKDKIVKKAIVSAVTK